MDFHIELSSRLFHDYAFLYMFFIIFYFGLLKGKLQKHPMRFGSFSNAPLYYPFEF